MDGGCDIQYLKGVGPALAKRFARLGILTVGDLLEHYPRKYIDYTAPYPLAQAPYDADCCVKATLLEKSAPRRIGGGRTLLRAAACDDEGGTLQISWFNTAYAADKLTAGETYYFEGRFGGSLTRREVTNPVVRGRQQVDECPLTAVYPATEGLPSSAIARAVQRALDACPDLPDPLSPALRQKYRLPDKNEAVRAIHRPQSLADAQAARRRLIFEELLTLQLGIFLLQSHGSRPTGAPMHRRDLTPFWQAVPFAPTGAQKRAAEEICDDLCGSAPMNRLLQGDVGSGKTLVAAAAVWHCVKSGYQAALMAPTEILARQHAESLSRLLGPMGLNVALLTGGMKARERKTALAAIAEGQADLVVGTHAVLTDSVQFARLGLAVVDEQHRFGVRQRGLLAGKARDPHLLVMSATPIPRTLGLLLYGNLNISILDELPPGRKPVRTWFITGQKRRDMYGYIEKQLAAGHQAYIVCPAIDESELDAGIQAAKTYRDEVAAPLLPGRRVGLMHGKLKSKEKAEVMAQFAGGALDVLVSTTVIEVGVDVPNATVMVVENAERFGLSALHQLRGRVGRGSAEACCILISDHQNDSVRERLRFLCRTTDGFAVARYDLETRGPGDFFGAAQHGLPRLQIADLMTDSRVLNAAQGEAKALLADDPQLRAPENQPLAAQVEKLFAKAGSMN